MSTSNAAVVLDRITARGRWRRNAWPSARRTAIASTMSLTGYAAP